MSQPTRLWHVTVTLSGAATSPFEVREALRRLNEQRPYLHSMKFGRDRAEIQFWEEGETLLDASSLALRCWQEYRESADLPDWEVVGLEVMERSMIASRGQGYAGTLGLNEVTPIPF